MGRRSRKNHVARNPAAQGTPVKSAYYEPAYGLTNGFFSQSGTTGSGHVDFRGDKYGAALMVATNEAAYRSVNAIVNRVGTTDYDIIDTLADDTVVASNNDRNPVNILARIIKATETRTDDGRSQETLFTRWSRALAVAAENYIEIQCTEAPIDGRLHRIPVGIDWLNPLGIQKQITRNKITAFWYNGDERVGVRLDPDYVSYTRQSDDLRSDVDGHPPLASARLNTGIVVNASRIIQAFFRNNGTPGAIATISKDAPGILDNRPAYDALANIFREYHKGVDNAWRMALLPYPLDITQFEQPDLKQWVDAIKGLESEIYTVFGVPRSIAGDADTSRYQTSPDDQRRFNNTCLQYINLIEDGFNDTVAPYFDPSGRYVLRFDRSAYEQITPEAVDVASKRYTGGFSTLNEARRNSGLDELPGGDVLLIPSGMITISLQALASGQLPAAPMPTTPTPPALPAAVETPAPVASLPDVTKDLGEPLFVGLSLANNADLVDLQRRVMAMHPDVGIQWTNPEEYHATVLYAPAVDEVTAKAFCEALCEVEPPDTLLRIGQLNTFDNVGEHALHFRIRSNVALKAYQSSVYDLAQEYGISCSQHSNPGQYTPHITLGYLPEKTPRVTYDGKIKIAPKGVWCDYGDTTLWRSWDETPPTPSDDGIPETPPVKTVVSEGILTAPTMAIMDSHPAHNVEAVVRVPRTEVNPLDYITDDTQATEYRAWLKFCKQRAGKTMTRPFDFKALPEHVGKYANTLIEYGLPLETIAPATAEFYVRTLLKVAYNRTETAFLADCDAALDIDSSEAIKALAQTESAFSDALVSLFKKDIRKNVFKSRMDILLTRYCRQAMIDGYADGGIEDVNLDDTEDEDMVAASNWLEGHLNDQRQYIANVADALFSDESLSDAEIENNKPGMWFKKSVVPSYNYGLVDASGNALGEFKQVKPTIDTCPDCVALRGQKRRMGTWYRYFDGELPPTSKTQCQGFQCGDLIVPTTGKVTAGNLPRLRGAGKSAHVHQHEELAV